MARLTFFVLLAAMFGSICNAKPTEQQKTMLTAASDKWSWEDCGDHSYPVHIESIEITPDPPQKGKNMTVTVVGTADREIEDGAYADVVVKVGAIKLLQKEFDVCEEARTANASVQCPVSEGKHKVIQTVTLPNEIPPAPFAVSVRGYTVDDDDMACLNIKIDFRPPTRGGHLGW